VVDLGGWQAVANPLHIPVSGPLASLITRGYQLYALPAGRLRVATDWLTDILDHRQLVQLGLIPSQYSSLAAAEHTDIYDQSDGQPIDRQRQASTT
jgi:NADH dehydrogenase